MSSDLDPGGLIRESYLIPGITPAECRSIFLDWALRLPAGLDPAGAARQLLELYKAENPDHPMTAILRDGGAGGVAPQRRGGRSGRTKGAFTES